MCWICGECIMHGYIHEWWVYVVGVARLNDRHVRRLGGVCVVDE